MYFTIINLSIMLSENIHKTTLYIMSGLPFSGKSLFSEEVEEYTSIVRVGFDDVWNELLLKIPDLTYDMAIVFIEKKLSDLLIKDISVIYDSTNLKEEHRKRLLYLAEKAHAKGVILYIPTTIEETYARQAQSLLDKSHHVIDLQNIKTVLENIEIPKDCILLKTEQNKQDFLDSLKKMFPKI